MSSDHQFILPGLPYGYGALGPHISEEVMKLHHDRHHRAYIDKLNGAVAGVSFLRGRSLQSLLSDLDSIPSAVRQVVRNNGGGHYNHSLFWQWMSPDGGGEPSGELAQRLAEAYGSYQGFVDAFSEKALGVFGSGWVWLQPDMSIVTTPNQDSPIMNGGEEPLLGLDVWEHAYYIDYKNVRADYVKAWWEVVNWDLVVSRYQG